MPRYAAYRDANVIAECDWQASLAPKARHWFRAFYGIEGKYLLKDY
jgi:hypothetical protein